MARGEMNHAYVVCWWLGGGGFKLVFRRKSLFSLSLLFVNRKSDSALPCRRLCPLQYDVFATDDPF
jgi:hypothetical protein